MEVKKYRAKRMDKIAATAQPTTINTIDLSASGLSSFVGSTVAVGITSMLMTIEEI